MATKLSARASTGTGVVTVARYMLTTDPASTFVDVYL